MKLRILLVGAVVGVSLVGTAFGFGLPSIGGGTSSKSTADPDTFLAKSQASEQLVNNSATLLFGLVASKEALAKIEAIQQKIAATTNSDEKKSLTQEKNSSQLNEISKASANKELESDAKNWDSKKKEQAKGALFNLALGAKMASDLVPEGQNMTKSMQTNPMMVTKLGSITNALKSLGGIITGSGKVLTALPPVFSAAKIDVELPKASTDKPKPMADIPG